MIVELVLSLAALPPADHVVTPGNSIQDAIAGATSGDRVLVEAGTYAEAIDFQGKAIEVVGLGGAGATTIDASTTGGPAVRFHGGEGPDSILRGFTITGGSLESATRGGGISCFSYAVGPPSSTPTVADCVITGNSMLGGGGGVGGDPLLVRCAIVGNWAGRGDGGGVWGAPTMLQCVVADNAAYDGYGGGLFATAGTVDVEDCVIVGNLSDQSSRGGGVHVEPGAQVQFERTVIADNHADGLEGPNGIGLYLGRGGGVYVSVGATVAFESCTVARNRATTTIDEPPVPGIAAIDGPFTARNLVVYENVPPQDFSASSAFTYSNVEGGAPGTGNIDAAPGFLDSGVGEYHLATGSPCIDAGDPSTQDPDGSVRDMGAFPRRALFDAANLLASDWSAPGWPQLPLSTGGVHRLALDGGSAAAGDVYWIFGSATGTSPGIPGPAGTLPLNPDPYLAFTVGHPNQGPLGTTLGLLDADGIGRASVTIPAATDPSLAGVELNHAGVVLDPLTLATEQVTNAVAVELVP